MKNPNINKNKLVLKSFHSFLSRNNSDIKITR